MGTAGAAATGSTAGSVLMVLMAAVVATVLGVHTTDLGEPCASSSWLERDVRGRWSLLPSVKVDTRSKLPPSATHLTWAALKEDAQRFSVESGAPLPQDGRPLPILTCITPSTPCYDFASTNATCTRVALRALCVAVGRRCQALVVTIEEPRSCCCGRKGRNTTLTGKVTNMRLRNSCPLSFEGRGGGTGEGRGGRGEQPILSSEGSAVLPSMHEDPPDVVDFESFGNTTSDGTSERSQDNGGITEEQVKDSSVLEDVIAALVFLFVGAILVLIKSRLFRFTKKKKQQEDVDVESEETLVDETII